jgi:hypothetical protein
VRHLAPWIVVSCALCSHARAQTIDGEEIAPVEARVPDAPPPDEVEPVREVVPEPPQRAPFAQATDDERPPVPRAHRMGEGLRLFIAIQLNTLLGDIDSPSIEGSSVLPTRPSLAGVPDALLGVRVDRFTAAVGLSWSQVATSVPMIDPCGSTMFQEFDTVQTTVGVIPTARFDIAVTDDGRGRLEAGVAVPILISNRSQDMPTFMCPSSSMSTDATTGVYGVDAMFGGRFHLFEAFTVGLEFGLSFLVFDPEDIDSTPFEEPSTTSLAAYSGLSLAIEVGL